MKQTTGDVLKRLEDSLSATNVLSQTYEGHILSHAYKIAEVANKEGRERGREDVRRAFDGMIDPDGYDPATVNELIRRIFQIEPKIHCIDCKAAGSDSGETCRVCGGRVLGEQARQAAAELADKLGEA